MNAMLDDRGGRRPPLLRGIYVAIAVLVVIGVVLVVASRPRGTTSGNRPAAGGGTTPTAGTTAATPHTGGPVATVSPAPPLGLDVQGTAAQIPWAEVGAGWTLALWQAAPSSQAEGTDTLFLVDPLGGRYLVSPALPSTSLLLGWAPATRVLLAETLGQGLFAVDLAGGGILWRQPTGTSYQDGFPPVISGDGQRVLVEGPVSGASGGTTEDVRELDLRSGKILHELTLPELAGVGYTEPQGLAMVVDGDGTLEKVSPEGSLELTFPASFSSLGGYDGSYLYTPDGQEVVMGAARGLALVSNGGTVVAQLPVPAPATTDPGCQALEWWSAGVVLATCNGAAGSAYWVVPLSGAAPTMLGTGEGSGVFGKLWNVAGATFGESGACGTTWIDRLGPDGTFAEVTIPGITPSEQVVGTAPGQLQIVGDVSSCDHDAGAPPAPAALVRYSPSAGTTTFLLGPAVNGGTVLGALGYPAPQP